MARIYQSITEYITAGLQGAPVAGMLKSIPLPVQGITMDQIGDFMDVFRVDRSVNRTSSFKKHAYRTFSGRGVVQIPSR